VKVDFRLDGNDARIRLSGHVNAGRWSPGRMLRTMPSRLF
jgi:hypothetical protein